MQSAEISYADILTRYKTRLVPRPAALTPTFASEQSLFAAIDSGRNDPAITGMFAHELPVSYVRIGNPLPAPPGVLTLLTQAIADETPVELIYLALRSNAVPMVHTIHPVALERVQQQWQLLAQDFRSHQEMSVFVLSRILKATRSRRIRPARFVAMNEQDVVVSLPVQINPRYTSQQQAVVAHEMSVEDGAVRLPSRAAHILANQFQAGSEARTEIWPPLVAQ